VESSLHVGPYVVIIQGKKPKRPKRGFPKMTVIATCKWNAILRTYVLKSRVVMQAL